MHLLLYMQKQQTKKELLKKHTINTRLHQGPVFASYKPNNEKAKQNILYRGALSWNELAAEKRNMDFNSFMSWLKNDRFK